MNDRHNRIAGCQAAVDAARLQCDIAARRLADNFMSYEDEGWESLPDSREYRIAQENYSIALDSLSCALMR
jgi:hypothetical protein